MRHHRIVRLLCVFAGVVATGSIVRAETVGLYQPAAVEQPAERVITSGVGLLFPMAPSPVCEVFNNFGGESKSFGPGAHQGLDIGSGYRQEVYAVEDGFLYRAFDGSGSGLGWGLWSDTDTKYRYFHLDELEPGLEVGDRVEVGQVIGYVGDTGNAAPGGWHLHFEVRPGPHPHDTPVDPLPLLDVPTICNVY